MYIFVQAPTPWVFGNYRALIIAFRQTLWVSDCVFSFGHLAETGKGERTDRDGVWMILAVQMPVAPEWCESVMLLLFWSQEETIVMQSTLATVSPVTTLPPVLCDCLQRPFLSLSLVLLGSRPLSLYLRPWFGKLRALQSALDKCIGDSAPFALIVKYVSLFSYYFLLLPHYFNIPGAWEAT